MQDEHRLALGRIVVVERAVHHLAVDIVLRARRAFARLGGDLVGFLERDVLDQAAPGRPPSSFEERVGHRAADEQRVDLLEQRFDDRDLKLERVKLVSQQGQYFKQYREAMAKHDRSQAAIALAQLDQVGAQLGLIDEQLTRIEMIAPYDGIILSGDLSQKLGAPVVRGQVLFEVAPLDSFRIAREVFAEIDNG